MTNFTYKLYIFMYKMLAKNKSYSNNI